ncbi:MAG: rRNA pseudouridine synthase [Gemmatimonadota bacterium]|nr:rRNA pseudouridine synthase [Gemmatimonadota bacterium]
MTGHRPIRIHRALARAGVASRRHAEDLVAAGRVTVNGTVARIGQPVDPVRDAIAVDGTAIAKRTAARWIVLNKSRGVMTTRSDPQGRRTVFDLVPRIAGLTYVGRLDFLTEGVLLLTTDGDAAHALTHPSRQVERTYTAVVRGNAAAAVRVARRGVELEDGIVVTRDVEARLIGERRWEFIVTVTEGRNREVRRLCDALGLEIERLVRTRFGPILLGDLPAGRSRDLTKRELQAIEVMTVEGWSRS